ncbi:MAG: pyridoxamine 5'-phosphate oxidase family protein [Rhodocyclales bacterium]|nr:pyridoxamine 5'-phosphate oxidase family protein [Rhodocyclales bacterium]
MKSALPPEVAACLAGHNVMSLASQGPDGPWASAVFYVWADDGLIFLSAPTTRHSRNLAVDPRCAATIHDDTSDWKAVKGIQIEGRVERLDGEPAKRAGTRYAEKFPLLRPLAAIPPAIAEALAKIAWYRLAPTRIYFIDNARGFGHREEFSCS